MNELADATDRRVRFKSFAYKDARTALSAVGSASMDERDRLQFCVFQAADARSNRSNQFRTGGRAALANLTYEVVTSE
ncbi:MULTISPECIES: hypothetical protein [Bradyrhizobium]